MDDPLSRPRTITTIDGAVVPHTEGGSSPTWPAGVREWVDADDYEGLRQVANDVMDERDRLLAGVDREVRVARERIGDARRYRIGIGDHLGLSISHTEAISLREQLNEFGELC